MVKTRSRTGSVTLVEEDIGHENGHEPINEEDVVLVEESNSNTPSSSSAASTSFNDKSFKVDKRKTSVENSKKRKSSPKKKGGNGNGTILAYFKGSNTISKSPKSDEDSASSDSEEKEPKKKLKIDPKTREFLDSGVPDVVIRRQQLINQKKSTSPVVTVSDVDDEGEDCMTPPKPKQKPKRGRPPKKVSSAAVTISSTKKKTAKKEEQKEDVIEVEEQLDDEDSICIPDPTPTPEDNDDDDFKPRRSLRSRTTVSYRQVRTPSNSSCSPSPAPSSRKKKDNKKTMDQRTKEFLKSGIPDVVAARSKKVKENGVATDSGNKRKSKSRKKAGSIKSYFIDDSSSSSSSDSDAPKVEPRKVLDPMTRAFLDSGVPEVVVKAQKFVELKKVEDDYLSLVGFFPKLHHVPETTSDNCTESSNPELLPGVALTHQGNDDDLLEDNNLLVTSIANYFLDNNCVLIPRPTQHRHKICCGSPNLLLTDELLGVANANPIPWVEECKGSFGLKDLCCNKEALSKLTVWLKQWKSDIKDDGGTSRKIEVKKKRGRDSDDDFVTSSEEDEDLKKKSVLLCGPPGCGKTSAVYAAAKHYGFHVVEVNFSSRRPGKDVIQRVEEAVLSHRLESTQNCLLLFEDIDLVDPKEDEGFHSAVAQLITTAVRPIAMTTSCLGQLSLDPKLEKKDPLFINFTLPTPSQIVRKVLCPMILSRASIFALMDDDERESQKDSEISAKLAALLDTICRHGGNDVRQVINQTQFLFTFSDIYNSVTSTDIHQHSSKSELLLDLDFIRPSMNESNIYYSTNCNVNKMTEDCEDDDDMRLSVKARNKLALKKLDSVAEMLTFACDLDASSKNLMTSLPEDELTRLKRNYLDPNLCTAYFACCESGVNPNLAQSIIMDSNVEIENNEKRYKLFDEIGEYCDNIYSDGGWESAAYVRTIIKKNMMDSVGRLAKRNGRVTSYFNRLDRSFTDRICQSFGFDKELDVVKNVMKNVC